MFACTESVLGAKGITKLVDILRENGWHERPEYLITDSRFDDSQLRKINVARNIQEQMAPLFKEGMDGWSIADTYTWYLKLNNYVNNIKDFGTEETMKKLDTVMASIPDSLLKRMPADVQALVSECKVNLIEAEIAEKQAEISTLRM